MGRPMRLGLATLAALLVVCGAYTVFWFIAAGQIKSRVAGWAQSAQGDKVEVSWKDMSVTGFPGAFRVRLDRAALRDNRLSPPPQVQIPLLSGTARPWDFAVWRIAAAQGFSAELVGTNERPPVRLTAQTADGVVSLEPEGGWKLWLTLYDANIEAAGSVHVSSADAWIITPPKSPGGQFEPTVALASDLRQVRLPAAVGPLGDTVEDLDFGITVTGAIPNGRLAQAAAQWRDAGGMVEVDNLRLNWGGLGATATGTVALDQDLQPVGGFSGAVQGYDKILTALVQSGHMRAADAGLARIALTMLAKAGPDGRPEIRTAFTIQNGQMFLGPAKLGQAPRITWP